MRTVFSIALVILSVFTVAPTAQAVVTDAQFTAFSNRVYASNKAMLARIATLESQVKYLESSRSWLEKAQESIRFTPTTNTSYLMDLDVHFVANKGALITGEGPALEVQGNILATRRYWYKPVKFYLDGDIDATGHGGFNIETKTPTFLEEQGITTDTVTAAKFYYQTSEGVVIDIMSSFLHIQGLFEALGVQFQFAQVNSPAWIFQSWIKTVLGQWLSGDPCQVPYSTCNDNNPCTVDWCSAPSSTCQHQLAQECSGM